MVSEFGFLAADEIDAGDVTKCFGVEYRGRTVYPAWQFRRGTSDPLPIVAAVLERLPDGLRRGGLQLAVWWITPNDLLELRRPLDVALTSDDDERLLAAAEAESREWDQASGVQ